MFQMKLKDFVQFLYNILLNWLRLWRNLSLL
nr:MAG TPA: Glucagon-like peptide 1 receptor, Exendin-4-bound G protein-coupled receptor extracellular [Caudoviricetes sp.]DAS89007.1 MAG TPA: Glucagon-like peptide 1 receptor, Exendin-4-bound G protein-coupled receptor extracellular [Caudoviricetes sp.]